MQLGKYATIVILSTLAEPKTLVEISTLWFNNKGRLYQPANMKEIKDAVKKKWLVHDGKHYRANMEKLLISILKDITLGENNKLIEQYKKCDVFCLPAIIDSKGDTEGLGVVLLEALNYGRPVVASGVGGITDIIKHEQTGLLAEQKNPSDLAAKLISILLDGKKAAKLAKQGCEYAKFQFSWEKIMDQWDHFYAQSKCHKKH